MIPFPISSKICFNVLLFIADLYLLQQQMIISIIVSQIHSVTSRLNLVTPAFRFLISVTSPSTEEETIKMHQSCI